MYKIAFFAHAVHAKTQSCGFLVDILRSYGTVDVFYGHKLPKRVEGDAASEFSEWNYDCIIVFQMVEILARLDARHPNVVFVPMYDEMVSGGQFYWSRRLGAAKVLCFSWKVREHIMKDTEYFDLFQYFPDPGQVAAIEPSDGLRGFFWCRDNGIPARDVARVCGDTRFELLHIHGGLNGRSRPERRPWPDTISEVKFSEWYESPADYLGAVSRCNVFFAPRLYEGIGMSFLEGMAMGQCVVAPRRPTMDEYISDGTNGLLYDPARPEPLDFSRAAEMGERARESVERGFRRWQSAQPRLCDFITTPKGALTARSVPVAGALKDRRSAPNPVVTVVTVCRNAADCLERTMQSVLEQSFESLEYIVLDGGSSDGTREIIEHHAHHLAHWRSLPDGGPYNAMNDALEFARGEWILFMNAGDRFASEDAIARMYRHLPPQADVVYGHHLFRELDGSEVFRRASDFETTWAWLQAGNLSIDWLNGIPCHQATAIRRGLLARLRFDKNFEIAADHELLFRARSSGVRFFNCDELVAVYDAGGLSAQRFNQCVREWRLIALKYGPPSGGERFFRQLEAGGSGGQARRDGFGGRGTGLVVQLERKSAMLGWALRRLLRNPSVRLLARAGAAGGLRACRAIAVLWQTIRRAAASLGRAQ